MKYVNIAGVTIYCVKTHPSNKTRMARDCFAAAQRLQYAWFQTMSADLDDALSAPIREWLDAGSREFYIYDRLLLNDLLAKNVIFRGHLPFHQVTPQVAGCKVYYILFSDDSARTDENQLWVLVLKDVRRQRPFHWT